MLDFRGIESPPMNNLVLRVVFISISRAEYILVEASFRNTYYYDDHYPNYFYLTALRLFANPSLQIPQTVSMVYRKVTTNRCLLASPKHSEITVFQASFDDR